MVKFSVGTLGLLCLYSVAVHAAQELATRIDRAQIQDYETVTLTLVYAGEERLDPDLGALEQDFEIVGRSRSHNTRIVNGEVRVQQTLSLQLAPLRAGVLSVPVLQFKGASSRPLSLVVEASSSQDLRERSHFIEVDVSNKTPWVQQQVLYRVRIFQRTPMIDGSLSEPVADGINLERLGADRSYRETRDGISWDVHERRYALFPQRSGRIRLAPVRLLARVSADRDGTSFFNRQTRQIRLRGDAIELDVRAAEREDGWWLPANALSLTANWLDAGTVRVGDPVTLEITLTANGALASMLPELPVPSNPDIKVYAGRSESGQQALASGIVSQRRVRHQVVPTRAGTMELADVAVSWWNTQQARAAVETASAPALEVAATLDGAERMESVLPQVQPPAPDGAEEADDARFEGQQTGWERLAQRWLTQLQLSPYFQPGLQLFSGFVAVLGLLFLSRRWSRRYQRGRRAALRAFARALEVGDRATAQQQLLRWAALTWPEHAPKNLPEIAQRLGLDTRLGERVRWFDRALHGATADRWQDRSLVRELAEVRSVPIARSASQGRTSALPSLGAAWDR